MKERKYTNKGEKRWNIYVKVKTGCRKPKRILASRKLASTVHIRENANDQQQKKKVGQRKIKADGICWTFKKRGRNADQGETNRKKILAR